MIFSNLIIFFIEVATAATLFRAGKHDVSSALEAAQARKPLLGRAAALTWAVGMIGSGLLAVPALVGSSAQAVVTAFGWPRGLEQKPGRAKGFDAVLAVGMLTSLLMNFLGINPIRALVLSAALNGLVTPPLLILLLRVANKRSVMGEYTNGLWLNLLGWGTTGIMFLGAVGLLATLS